ncbi:MAG: hypothetical protein Q7T55_26590, partial [Solirubrobacteraceae bacterium]|nr:hypothetical protein [Solirubrobacteraceae bacterium]
MDVSRAFTAVAVAAVLVTTACAAEPDPTEPGASDSATVEGAKTPEGASTGTTATALDPSYAVEAPGKRTGALGAADILITAKDTLSADLVQQIEALDGVQAATTISLANVPLENKVYNLAAVDPAEYRRFTSQQSADLQAQWDRVAAGEVAVSSTLRKQLPVGKDGVLRLGAAQGADVHVGAWAPQAEKVDLVVNRKRGEALGMVPDNALLIAT